MKTVPYTHHAPRIGSLRKFYFCEYYYIYLKSIVDSSTPESSFALFLHLRAQQNLGESKYKKIKHAKPRIQVPYMVTYAEVKEECHSMRFVSGGKETSQLPIVLEEGHECIRLFEKSFEEYREYVCFHIEATFGGFRALLEFLYQAGEKSNGLLIFPSYSPAKLEFSPRDLRTYQGVDRYLKRLQVRLSDDLLQHLKISESLEVPSRKLEQILQEEGLLGSMADCFPAHRYNVLAKRVRDFWLSYFLREVYQYSYSLTVFENWAYRAKQFGIAHATEFYPGVSAKIVYPTSLLYKSPLSEDFKEALRYQDGARLYLHRPYGRKNEFVRHLTEAYYDIRRTARTHFVNLLSVRELTCYRMKVSEGVFRDMLEEAYKLNLKGELSINISLEVDRLPEETKAVYVKRGPVLVDGKARNIISIEIARKDFLHE